MKPAESGGPDYRARIRRAEYLATAHPFAAEVLTLYQKIAECQNKIYRHILRNGGAFRSQERAQLWSGPNSDVLVSLFPEMLAMLQSDGPAPIRETARQLSAAGKELWKAQLADFWMANLGSRAGNHPEESREPLTEFILRAFAQPCAEFAEAQTLDPALTANYRMCPRCSAAPVIGVLRPEGDGGKRRLLCSFCLREWDSRRIFCAACGEDNEKKLPVYVAEQFPHIRVEACETCHFYVRTIDLTKDGNAVPIVDDLAAMPLSLWAEEHCYKRLHQNLLGT
jgi:formate dehydrogenase accessory protein FdhE